MKVSNSTETNNMSELFGVKKSLDVIGILLCLPDEQIGANLASLPFSGVKPTFLINVVDRSQIQRSVECMVTAGIKKVFIFTHVMPESIREILGDGTRWGIQIDYALIQNPSQPLQALQTLSFTDDTNIYISSAHIVHAVTDLSALELPSYIDSITDKSGNSVSLFATLAQLKGLPQSLKVSEWGEFARQQAWSHHQLKTKALQCLTGQDVLDAQEAILTKAFPAQISGYEIEPGIWMSRNVVLHPTVSIHPPVFFGEDCRLDAGVVVGPNVVIGHTSRIGNETVLSNSAVQAGTWLGEQLTSESLLIQGGQIWDAQKNVSVPIIDPFLIANLGMKRPLSERLLKGFARIIGRISALLIWLFTLPLQIIYRWTQKHSSIPDDEVILGQKLATPEHLLTRKAVNFPLYLCHKRTGIHHLLGWMLPSLLYVGLGRWYWVGLPPRSLGMLKKMDEDWRIAYLSSKIGVLDEAWIVYQGQAEFFEERLSELYYASRQASVWHDIQLLFRYPSALLRRSVRSR